MRGPRDRFLLFLLALNLALQLADGAATYVGIHAGFEEGNPLVARAVSYWGPAVGILLFKFYACACLLLIWLLRGSQLAGPALLIAAIAYVLGSLMPWATALSQTHFS